MNRIQENHKCIKENAQIKAKRKDFEGQLTKITFEMAKKEKQAEKELSLEVPKTRSMVNIVREMKRKERKKRS